MPEQKNKAAQALAKLSHGRLNGLTPEQRSEYFKAVRAGKKGKVLKDKLVSDLSST